MFTFQANFEQNIGLQHISSTEKSEMSQKTSIYANIINYIVCTFFLRTQIWRFAAL